jgi:hypothetical protein
MNNNSATNENLDAFTYFILLEMIQDEEISTKSAQIQRIELSGNSREFHLRKSRALRYPMSSLFLRLKQVFFITCTEKTLSDGALDA